MPGGFCLPQIVQILPEFAIAPDGRGAAGGGRSRLGNPPVLPGVRGGVALPAPDERVPAGPKRVPQFRQKMDPEGLSRLQFEQRGIRPPAS